MQKAGAVLRRFDAVIAGGARMFDLGEMDIGARNAAAVKAGLARSRRDRSRRRRRAATAAARCA